MLVLKPGCLLVLLYLVGCVTSEKHRKKNDKHRHKHDVKRQAAANSYENYIATGSDQSGYTDQSSSSYSSTEHSSTPGYNTEQNAYQGTGNEASVQSAYSSETADGGTSDQSSLYSNSNSEATDESQPAWCQDNKMCSNFHKSDCEKDEWVILNCPRRCNLCLENYDSSSASSTGDLNTNTSAYQTTADSNETATPSSYQGKPANSSQGIYYTSTTNQSQTATSPLGSGAASDNSSAFSDNKLRYNYTMEIDDLPQSKLFSDQPDESKQRKRPLLDEEDINVTLPGDLGNKEAKKVTKTKQTSKESTSSWCKDEETCSSMKSSECGKDWMQLNCPKKCGICKGGEVNKVSAFAGGENKEKQREGYLEDIRVTLPSGMLTSGEEICEDHVECVEYPVSSCHQNWMKKNCLSKCGLCKGKGKNVPETNTMEYTLSKTGDTTGVCYYDGIPHAHGSKWSPGPCTPECDCQDGNVRCSVIQCPRLTCVRQVKNRWSCCPECSEEDKNCVKATEARTKNSSCCVLPFIFKGVQYETCTDEKYDQPWCSLTENFDVDGKWGVCVEPKPMSTTVDHFANTKPDVIPSKLPEAIQEKPHRFKHHPKPKAHAKSFAKPQKERQDKSHRAKDETLLKQAVQNVQAEHEQEREEEEILRKYGAKETEEELNVEPEPLDGAYTEWSPWSTCVVSCGGGVQERFRKCSHPPPAFGGLDCNHIGPAIESRKCNTSPCPVHGGFGSWSPWVECSSTCGGGITTRSRLCDNPLPRYGGKNCAARGLGQAIESKACNNIPCEDNGAFTPWSEWSECDRKCGGGVSIRRRTCTSSLGYGNGHDCSLRASETETKACNVKVCPVDGGYTPWTEWSACSRSCGPGIASHHRTCTQPIPSETGKDCSSLGPAFEQKACFLKDCQASGNWTAWSDWNKCSVACGGGIQSRFRKCAGKTPCDGSDRQTQLCNVFHCPIQGKYTEWSAWGKCSKTCGDGSTVRTRKCTNPGPKYGGKSCIEQGLGPDEEVQKCNIRDCQVSHDGGYGSWSGWTKCSVTCGLGTMTRYRACDNPAPEGLGKDCSRLGVGTQSAQCFNQECPVHGNYSNWSDWSACSVTCGDGSRVRTRTCTNPAPEAGGNNCVALGDDVMSEPCFEAPCIVDAKLGEWSLWSGCSKSCGYGIRQRRRRCIGASQFGESYCDQMGMGQTQQAERCFERSCPVDGNFGPWSAWSECSTTCGGGAMSRFRNCSDPVPVHGGRGCERIGGAFEIKSCRENYCPVDGGFSSWSEYGPCSRTCGTGYQTRKRSCTSPPPEHGGKDCSDLGSTEDTRECSTNPCPINGGYTDWSDWSNCSVPCGNGVMARSRSCSSPSPSFGGQDCTSLGPRTEQENCIKEACPEHCSCGGWTSWSECDHSCGGGFQTRKRQCTPPKSGIESCVNEEQETQLCNLNVCPVDGAYSPWTAWSSCTGECGAGHRSRSRECNNPAPAFGGRPCQEIGLGPTYQSASCMIDPCPVHGKYSSWSPWSACSTTCGLGQKKRSRSCDNPSPAFGGLDCSRYGGDEEAVDCFVADCPVDGSFSPWSEWSECSKSCGWGYQSRERECNMPEPSHGGRDCTTLGDSSEVQPCIMVECPVDGKFSEWSAWGECSKTCGEGRKRRKRYCDSPKPDFGGKTCAELKLGDIAEISNCNLGPCPDSGGWGAWSAWSYCSASCGRGKRERSRQCDSPEPIGGGKPCVGLLTQQRDCSVRDCPVNGNYTHWGGWTECDVKCGRGFQTRWRSCSNPVATVGGQECTAFGPDSESRVCYRKPCKVDGSWGQWGQWSGCSKSCGDGVQVRTRVCDDPKPQAGGLQCSGPTNEEKYCRQRDCCDIPYVDLGCFVDTGNPSTMPELLLTDTDSSSPLFSGVEIKRGLTDWDDYMGNMICRCAQITNEKGYSHFGIQNLGECRSGVGVDKTYASQGARVAFSHQGPRPWVGCVGKGMKQCRRPSLNCVGQDQTNYVYGLKNIAFLNGNYTAWSLWSPCSKSCDRGITSRRRTCTNPPALYGGKDCSDIGPEEEIQECLMKACPVNGAWSGWAAWSECSASCGIGKRTRIRGCNSPKPSNGGELCSGPDTEIAQCYQRDCPADGRWSDWQAWEPCSVSCGLGVQLRTRYCNNPPPLSGGKMCEGDLVEASPCEAKPCPINGNYADWSNWSGCSRSCGRGFKVRMRKCISPVPRFGGLSCERLGPAEEKTHCNAYSCPVNGNWGAWTSWSKCSAECGPGVRTRERRCDNPYSNYGGKPCAGKGYESTVCSMPDCPIDGNWGAWSDWSDCQSDCGVATRQRTRACIDPPPAHGGNACEGEAEEYHDCKLDQCPIDGAYSDWSDWSRCDQPCGTGHKFRVRSCSNPEPQFGGLNCSALGPEIDTVACNADPCPVDGGWSGWSSWSSCSQTCGLGVTTRSRSCSYPVAEFGGKPCEGKSEEKKACKDFDCCDIPYRDVGCYIDAQRSPRPLPELLFSDRDKISWKKWKSFVSDLICRCAKETRNKQYTHFGVQHYGECYSGPESWKTYRDEGIRQDFTRPPDPQPWVGCVDENLNQCQEPNLECVGKQNTNFVYSVDQVQPIDGNYTEWTPWSSCSTSCGPGTRYRTRSCTNPAPSFSGQLCYNMGSDEELETCSPDDCPIDGGWGNWGEWSKCSASCGTGQITRARSCDNPTPEHGGKSCVGPGEETVNCNYHECPIAGMWSAWSAWSQCSSSCGNGQQSRKRECNDPKSENGGEPCVGTSVVFQNCVEKECPGMWDEWSAWSDCSRTCGAGGTHTRSRTCQGGLVCKGPRHDTAQCQLQPCPECTKSADVAFIVDSSAAADESVWNRMKSFARGIANAFVLHDDASRVGLITYSSQPTLELRFDEKNDRDEFSDFLNTVSASHGRSNLEPALLLASNELFVPEAGMRTKVPNVVVVFTQDGPTPLSNSYNDSASDLKEKGVTVIGVGVGDKVNQYELERVASGPEHAYMVSSLDDAIASIATIANTTCLAKPTPPQVKWGPWSDWSSCSRLCGPGTRHRTRSCVNGNECVGDRREEAECVLQNCPECKSTLDVVFAIPIADSIPEDRLSDAKKFVRGVIDGLNVSPQGTHVGLLGYFDYPRVELKLDTFYDKEDILRALAAMSTVDGFNNTRIDSALQAAQSDLFSQASGVRAYVPKVLVFLASGDATDQNLKAASMPLKTAGTTIIPLVVGDLQTSAVAPMGTSTRHYFASDTFDNLAAKLDKISVKLCSAPAVTKQSVTKPLRPNFKPNTVIHGVSQLLLKTGKSSKNTSQNITEPTTSLFANARPAKPQPIAPAHASPAVISKTVAAKLPAETARPIVRPPAAASVQAESRPAVALTSVLAQRAHKPTVTKENNSVIVRPVTTPVQAESRPAVALTSVLAQRAHKPTVTNENTSVILRPPAAAPVQAESRPAIALTSVLAQRAHKPTVTNENTSVMLRPPAAAPVQAESRPAVALTSVLAQRAHKPAITKENNSVISHPVPTTGLWKDWGAWSECSKSCGLGKSTRARLCDGSRCNGPPPVERTPCKLQDCLACNHNLDLVLAVDSSDAVSKEGWKKVKEFMTGILDAFRISEADTHVGILTFSSVPYLETRLSENFNKDDIGLLVNNMQQLQGKQRRIDKALRMAVAEFFSPKSRGFREKMSKAFVLITGGNPTEGSESLASAVRPLQQNGVSAVAVGVGQDIDEAQLRAVGRSQGYYMKVPNYDDLLSYVYPVVRDVCQAGNIRPPPLPPPVPETSSSKVTLGPLPLPDGSQNLRLPTKEIQSLINKWGTWSNWGPCSRTCSEGSRARSRDCAGYNCTGPSLQKETCFLQDCPDCQKGIDLVFVVDGSDDVADKEFMQEKSFVMNVLNAFQISKDLAHIGVATYGSDVSVDIPLTNQFDKDSLFVAVNSLIRSKGPNSLEKVLDSARTKLFAGSRDHVAKVLILLTSDKKGIPDQNLAELSQALKRSGIDVVAVGVGSSDRSARDVLSKVATSSSLVFPITSFDELVNNVYLVATSACQAVPVSLAADQRKETPSRPTMCGTRMDVAFALDSSDDVNSFQWQQQKDFVKQVIDGLRVAPDGVHTGIVAYAAMPAIDLKLNVHNKDKQQLLESVGGLGRAVGRRNIGSLLDMSKYEVFGPTSGRRTDAPSTFVILQYGADRKDANAETLKSIGESLRRDGVRVFVVGVGSKVTRASMASFASSASDIMHLPSLNNPDMAKKLIKVLCEAGSLKRAPVQPSQRQLPNTKAEAHPHISIVTQLAASPAKKMEKTKPTISQNISSQSLRHDSKTPTADKPAVHVAKANSNASESIQSTPTISNVSQSVQNTSKNSNVSKSIQNTPNNSSRKIFNVVARSCRELKRRIRGAEDGEFPIMFSPHCAPVNLYCHGMDTDEPVEYLTLGQGAENNYASFRKERLKNFHNCDGPTDPSPRLTANYWGTTRFSKIRVNPRTGLIKQDDFRFAISEGNPVKYGRGGDCFSLGQCRRGGFKIDLSGTGLKLRDDVKWTSWGAPKNGSRMINFTRSPDSTKVSAVCGGSCGGCHPATGRIYLTPSSCDVPLGKQLKRSVIEAVEVLDRPDTVHEERRHHVHRYSGKMKLKAQDKRQHLVKKVTKKRTKPLTKNISKKHSVKNHNNRKNHRKQ